MDRADLVCITLLIHNTLIIQAFLPKALMPENQSKLFGLRITNDTQYSYRKRLQYGGTEGLCKSRLTLLGPAFWRGKMSKFDLNQETADKSTFLSYIAQCSITPWKYKLNWCHIAIEWSYWLNLMIEIGKSVLITFRGQKKVKKLV